MANSYKGIEGQRVVVTAGASGIGRAISELLIAEGARVQICDVDEEFLADFAAACPEAGAMRADVAAEADVDRLFDAATERLGGLDALINNAGIAGPTAAIEDIDPADWRRCIDVDLTGQFLCARRAVPMLKATGGGSIVNLSSVAGKIGFAYRTPYSSAKFGVVGLTEALARELGPANIRVNAIQPGVVEGARIEDVIRNRAAMVTGGDIAAMAAFLLSDAGRNVSGQSIAVDANVETL
jgi:NAD(P)-dependent dehydrogenase (short-subunit alcohol dehydrogenase family)